ncbi:MAG: 1-acyl-sn-glycerol-3-phosphate acyltransferase [Phycisphaerales bacterium]|nr:1-acyl-sn-glycerol-3-phosphate acyltransferase [Phycisphaerales bacterium]
MFGWLQSKHPGTPLPQVAFYQALRAVLRLILLLFFRMRAYYPERVPVVGAALLVANHQSYMDPPIVGCPIYRRHLDFVARGGLFDNPAMGRLFSLLHSVPVKEDGGDTGAIKEVLRRLGAGRAVLIFPEGSRTTDGEVAEFKRGVAVLVKRSCCPVIPVAIEGAYQAWPRTRRLPRWFGHRVAVMYGRAIPHVDLMRDGPDAALKRLHDEVESMRAALRARPAAGAGYR